MAKTDKPDQKTKIKELRKKVAKLRKRLDRVQEAATAVIEARKGPLVSPLAPVGGMPPLAVIAGVEISTCAAGVRYQGRTDVMLARLAPGTEVAGVFTRSATRSGPVLDCQAKIGTPAGEDGAAFLINSGNSNAFTGAAGDASVQAICAKVSEVLNIPAARVFTSSTGVIGERLPHERITAVVQQLADSLSPDALADGARAIMTTDTFPKAATTTVTLDGKEVKIAGIAKGSGMIAPDMATMLVYIFTDAKISQSALQKMLSRLVDPTFNSITVDSDTSTSDTLLLAATGKADAPEITDLRSTNAKEFSEALEAVMMNLAHQVVRDGEGATKFVQVAVTGADNDADARKVAMAIANSPLVKTAVAGEDPNWGRVVMAVGKSGAKADRDTLSISFGDILVADKGWVSPDYREDLGATYMKQQDLEINVDLGIGEGSAIAWTCDLTNRYIEINADYRS